MPTKEKTTINSIIYTIKEELSNQEASSSLKVSKLSAFGNMLRK